MKFSKVGRKTLSLFKKIVLSVLSLVLIIAQIVLGYLVISGASSITWLYFLIDFLGFCCVINLLDKDMISSFKIIWILIILIFPFFGTVFYLFCANGKTMPLRKAKKIKTILQEKKPQQKDLSMIKTFDDVGYKHISILSNTLELPYHSNTNLAFYSNIDQKFQHVLHDIKNAKKCIYIETFIISSGRMLDELIEALKIASTNNVEIKICYDDFGSKRTFKESDFKKIKALKNAKIVKFAPLGFTLNLGVNYRNHRKAIIIDEKIAYVGGDNIADEYANYISRFGIWRDNAIRLEGDAVINILFSFAQTWYMSTKEILNIPSHIDAHSIKTSNIVFPYFDGPTDNKNPAYDLYVSLANNAKDYLYISTPYLIIDQEFLNHLVLASKSGVDVRILVPGIPDKKTVYLITRSHFGKLLKAGVKIYKYAEGFNHAKNYICDDKYATIGSVNIDYRSLFLHFENGVFVSNDDVVKQMKEDFLASLENAKEETLESWNKRSFISRIIEFVLKVFSTLM